MAPDDLPSQLRDAVAVALDDEAPKARRLRALSTLEHAREPHRRAVARALVPALHAPPDIAARAHLALLVLWPDLRLLREDKDGRDAFVAVERGMALDELHKLYAPGEDLPAFLSPPERPKPAPYRDPAARREEELRALSARRRAEHDALLMKMQEMGLDADDLDDDDDDDGDDDGGDGGARRRFVPLKGGTPWASFAFVDDRDAVVDNGRDVLALGRLRPGAWWCEATAGDHKGARRFRLGVAVDMAPRFTTRRERALDVGVVAGGGEGADERRGVTVTAGHADLFVDVDGRGVIVWIDADPGVGGGDGEVVGITLTWSSWRSFRPDPEKPQLSRNPGAPKPRR